MFVHYQPNLDNNRASDCVIRAITKILDIDWDTAYLGVVMTGFVMKDMPSVNSVWEKYLVDKGFKKYPIPDTCPECYTIADFAKDHPTGKYILGTGSHAVAVEDGNYFDNADSGFEIPIYYFTRSGEKWQDSQEIMATQDSK